MTDSFLVKLFLAIYGAAAFGAIYLLWRNSAAPDSTKNVAILVASILPVAISILPYLRTEVFKKDFLFVLIYDSKSKQLISGEDDNVYSYRYAYFFSNTVRAPDACRAENAFEFMGPKGFDIIEKGIAETLGYRFQSHWDISPQTLDGPSGRTTRYPNSSPLDQESFSEKQIRKVFEHNALVVNTNIAMFFGMSAPKGMKLNVITDPNFREIVFDNDNATLRIRMQPSCGGVAQRGVWGVLKMDSKDMNRFFTVEFAVSTSLCLKKMRVYAPEAEAYKKWFENVNLVLEPYDWKVLDRDIEKQIARTAFDKILK